MPICERAAIRKSTIYDHGMRLLALLVALVLAGCGAGVSATTAPPPGGTPSSAPAGVPLAAIETLAVIDRTGHAPTGYVGGRRFGNFEHHLPKRTASGARISYREWDIARHVLGVNRGPRRLVTGDDGSAYYSGDHYSTFLRIRSSRSA